MLFTSISVSSSYSRDASTKRSLATFSCSCRFATPSSLGSGVARFLVMRTEVLFRSLLDVDYFLFRSLLEGLCAVGVFVRLFAPALAKLFKSLQLGALTFVMVEPFAFLFCTASLNMTP